MYEVIKVTPFEVYGDLSLSAYALVRFFYRSGYTDRAYRIIVPLVPRLCDDPFNCKNPCSYKDSYVICGGKYINDLNYSELYRCLTKALKPFLPSPTFYLNMILNNDYDAVVYFDYRRYYKYIYRVYNVDCGCYLVCNGVKYPYKAFIRYVLVDRGKGVGVISCSNGNDMISIHCQEDCIDSIFFKKLFKCPFYGGCSLMYKFALSMKSIPDRCDLLTYYSNIMFGKDIKTVEDFAYHLGLGKVGNRSDYLISSSLDVFGKFVHTVEYIDTISMWTDWTESVICDLLGNETYDFLVPGGLECPSIEFN